MKIAKKKVFFYLEDLLYLKVFAEKKKMKNEIKGIQGRSGINMYKNINNPT